ncbi:MAG TPA: hypothetical protein VF041_23385 [Gemmatimonadaceae bacterium]
MRAEIATRTGVRRAADFCLRRATVADRFELTRMVRESSAHHGEYRRIAERDMPTHRSPGAPA